MNISESLRARAVGVNEGVDKFGIFGVLDYIVVFERSAVLKTFWTWKLRCLNFIDSSRLGIVVKLLTMKHEVWLLLQHYTAQVCANG